MKLMQDGRRLFPLGTYDMPRSEDEWRIRMDAGVRLMHCTGRDRLDLAAEHGSFGWARLKMVVTNAEEERALRDAVEELIDHPALALWQAPDEAIHFGSKLRNEGEPIREPWYLSDADYAEWRAHLDAVTEGLIRGAEIVREIDPSRPIWLNDHALANWDSRTRVAPAFDIMGFHMYPIGRDYHPLALFGKAADRHIATAPLCEIWLVQQGFSWSVLNKQRHREEFPSRSDLRFIAWQSLSRGATGLHWWGMRHVELGHPFLDLLWPVVRELHQLNDLLLGADMPGVQVRAHHLRMPPVYGLTRVARRAGDKRLIAVINQDPYYQNAVVSGLDEVGIDDPNDLRPLTPDDAKSHRTDNERFTRIDGGWVIPLAGHTVRVWSTEDIS